jgi:hypothetical protein
MDKSLVNDSGILIRKSKFFIYRAVIYFSFLLVPTLIPKLLDLSMVAKCAMMTLYIFFMVSQWFLLGKEVDHRLKIYFRVNSSVDRVIYRVILGMTFFILIFNCFSMFSYKWIYNSFWMIWVVLGLFYSWPTRGKIIQESVSSNFREFRYLDSFEKTLIGLIGLMFVVTIPRLPDLFTKDGLMLFFDPTDKLSSQYWNFIMVTYFPFMKYPSLLKIAWSLHFYIIGLGIFQIIFYAFLRFFVSRRLSLLGVFALISSWSVTKILVQEFGFALLTGYSLLWIWSLLWVTKSNTYRSGLFLGLVNYLGMLINQSYFLLIIIQILLIYFYFLKEKTSWYKRQLIKYSLFGMGLCFVLFMLNLEKFETFIPVRLNYLSDVLTHIDRKAIFALCFPGALVILISILTGGKKVFKEVSLPMGRIKQILVLYFILLVYGVMFDQHIVNGFSVLWMLAFLSLIPIEIIFQGMSRTRSSRNMIYLIYILICLLDSHFEGRVKIFLQFFEF